MQTATQTELQYTLNYPILSCIEPKMHKIPIYQIVFLYIVCATN